MKSLHKYLSYIVRFVVEESSSLHNDKLIVAIQDGKYVLNTQNANYSFGSLHSVFQKAFKLIKLKERNFSSCLVLGGGAGSVPSILYNELGLSLSTTVVEVDKEVIRLGKKYFKLGDYPKLTIINEDAFVFVSNNTESFDLIAIDIFKDVVVPERFISPVFFDNIKKRLNPNGVVIFNFVSFDFETKQQVKNIEQLLTTVFKNYTVTTHKVESLNRVFIVERVKEV
ncbi:MAG: fused MFS/spermidine synthase [Flavobacteriales bacterium]|nr:fused MFS/spermidine synthase [Flavobacteriales bacterium]MCW8911758.1 fused MFS/spermidine synthase [Flavobacteriales bacterium]MCW8937017.1 fused MFS/spermidine synthase [Flavobacteriales bacterium]MCW8968454.1 fused MFS/spermidine synthase [Flavobacteriales bacterium]MCW8989777.1 fused MFS/spermidine synthase [Flavobacteriales bacterium]